MGVSDATQDLRPHLAFMAYDLENGDPVGAIVCKQDSHRGGAERGYIAMLVVGSSWRKRGIARHLVKLSIDAMIANGADEVTLETEFDNIAALALYSALGFLREKRLFRFYMNGKDAFRLVRPLRPVGGTAVPIFGAGTNSSQEREASWDGEWRDGGYVCGPLSPILAQGTREFDDPTASGSQEQEAPVEPAYPPITTGPTPAPLALLYA
ncbi:N-alpha-acetyltransferase mak3 [Ceratobasidium sp. 395]|nr:N-alpha-acetyltransferase mak3 [Ceratobasidium sp. 395]